jgi:two-component system sensor histidine kinase UhpB
MPRTSSRSRASVAALVRSARDAERLALAQDLHDGVLPWLMAVRLGLGAGGDDSLAPLADAIGLALDRARVLVHQRTARPESEPLDELAAFCRIVARAGTPCRLVVRDTSRAPIERPLLRIVQSIAEEAIANALRHGRAGRIAVLLTSSPTRLALQVAHTGPIVTRAAGARRTLGLSGMHARAVALGGTFEWTPRASGGTRTRVLVPRTPARLAAPGPRPVRRALALELAP